MRAPRRTSRQEPMGWGNSLADTAGQTLGLESKNAFPVWPTLRLGIKKCIWDANPRSIPLCGWGGVSGISMTHVETLCSLIPPEDPGTNCGKPRKQARQGSPISCWTKWLIFKVVWKFSMSYSYICRALLLLEVCLCFCIEKKSILIFSNASLRNKRS